MANGPSPSQPRPIKRIVYKEIKNGDRRKFTASSNDANSGGGARDLRFSPYNEFSEVFTNLFPQQRALIRKRNGIASTETVLVGEFHWLESGQPKAMESQFEPPTDARSFEGRIAQVNKYPCFNNLPGTNEGVVFLLLIQQEDGTVWPRFTTEASLSSDDWDRGVADLILHCLKAKRRSGVAVAGYIDFENGKRFCNGT